MDFRVDVVDRLALSLTVPAQSSAHCFVRVMLVIEADTATAETVPLEFVTCKVLSTVADPVTKFPLLDPEKIIVRGVVTPSFCKKVPPSEASVPDTEPVAVTENGEDVQFAPDTTTMLMSTGTVACPFTVPSLCSVKFKVIFPDNDTAH